MTEEKPIKFESVASFTLLEHPEGGLGWFDVSRGKWAYPCIDDEPRTIFYSGT